MQTYIAANKQKWAIGKQIDVSIADGPEATVAEDFYSVKDFAPQNAPEPMMIEDSEGNRSTNTLSVIGDREYPFSFAGVTDINKIGRFIYYATGSVVSVQDGTTGAYKHVFKPLNNVILPEFTIFFNLGAEGYRRLKGCQISKLTVSITDSEAMFSVEGMGTGEDDVPNTASTISALTITTIAYQTTTGLTRYSFSGAPALGSVKNGDMLNVIGTGIVNDSNKGKFIVVSADNTAKTIDVINNERTDASDDESSLTSANNTITVVTLPVYPDPEAILLRRHSAVRDAVDLAGLDSAIDSGLRALTFEFSNNSAMIYERPKSSDPLAIFAKNLEVSTTFTQLISADSAKKAIASRDTVSTQQAWRLDLEDTSKFLGTSNLFHPLIRMEIPQAKGVATRNGMGSNDELTYDWTLHVSEEQSVQITIQNTTASYGA